MVISALPLIADMEAEFASVGFVLQADIMQSGEFSAYSARLLPLPYL